MGKRLAVYAVALLVILAAARVVGADTLSVAGRQVECGTLTIPPDKDFLAPLLQAIDALGITVVADARSATLVTPEGKKITFTAGMKTATVSGRAQRLALAPAVVQGQLWLPFQATCSLVGAMGRWEAGIRTLVVAPKVLKATLEREPDAVLVRLQASLPISSYNAGVLPDPQRIVVDVLDAVLAGPAQAVPSTDAAVTAIRLSQNRLNPDLVRLVLEVPSTQGYSVQTEDEGCRLTVRIPAARLETPPPGWVSLERAEVSGDASMLRLLVVGSGPLRVQPGRWEAATSAVFRIENALVPKEPLPVSGAHPLFKRLACEEDPAGGVRVRVELGAAQPFVIFPDRAGVRLAAGRLPLEQLSVVLDPGHGGNQPGTISRVSGPFVYEKEFNLDIALRLAKLLREAGARVTLTREGDCTLVPITGASGRRPDLEARAEIANALGADLFVSIHCNANPNASLSGFYTYYGKDNVELARLFQATMAHALGCRDGGIRRDDNLVVLRTAQVPAVLLEVGFLSNPTEASRLAAESYRQQIAEAALGAFRAYVDQGYLLADRARRAGQDSLPSRGGRPSRSQR